MIIVLAVAALGIIASGCEKEYCYICTTTTSGPTYETIRTSNVYDTPEGIKSYESSTVTTGPGYVIEQTTVCEKN